jgi:hypothetical protein
LLIGAYGLYQVAWVWPYERFVAREEDAIPQFIALDNAVLAQFPPPPGVDEKKKINYPGGGAYHGTSLRVEYKIKSTNRDEIVAYYQALLTAQGWLSILESSDHFSYSKDTSCMYLSLPYRVEELDVVAYSITIFHDYRRQEFSPDLPPIWYLSLHEHGKTRIKECPPVSR